VQLGAPLELQDSGDYTALDRACHHGHEAIAKALLDGKYEGRGADADARDADGNTLLMVACDGSHEGIVPLLLARGARPELQSRSGWTALHNAVLAGHPGIVALLCAAPGAAVALAVRKGGWTPLGFSVHQRQAACEAVLRAHGAPE